MADVSMNVKILQVTKTTSQWATVTDVISKGLLCIEIDGNEKSWAKVGDGVHTYAELPYITDGAIASLGNFLRVKGVVATVSDLPETGNTVGDVYFVGSAQTAGSDKFEEYVWTSADSWEFIGKIEDPPVYTGGSGITITNQNVVKHSNSVTAGTASGSSTKTLTFGDTFSIPSVTYDSEGHITAKGTTTMTMPANPNTTYSLTQDPTDGHKIILTPSSGNAQIITIPDNNTTYGLSGSRSGDTWVTTLTAGGSGTTSTVPVMGAASGSTAGTSGLVPKPTNSAYYLRGDATWQALPTASTSVPGIVQLNDTTTSTSTTQAATANAVKAVADAAAGKSTVSVSGLKTSGLDIGTITIDGTGNTVKVPTGTTSSTVALGNHTHTTTIAAGSSGDTSQLTMSANTKYKITSGGTSYIFTTPASTSVSLSDTVATGTKIATVTIDGTATDINLQTTALATSSATADITLAASTKYQLTAGNNSIVFQTPPNTTYQFDGTYNASTNKAATVKTVTDAIGALDVPSTGTGAITGMSAAKTIATLTETDGKIAATFQDIEIANTQVTGLGAAATKGITDNSTATAVTSTDTNLITGRTLYNAGYIKTISIDGTSDTSFTGIAKSVKINNKSAVSAGSTTGQIALTGIGTGLKYTNTSGTATTLSPDTDGNFDVTSLILNCTL